MKKEAILVTARVRIIDGATNQGLIPFQPMTLEWVPRDGSFSGEDFLAEGSIVTQLAEEMMMEHAREVYKEQLVSDQWLRGMVLQKADKPRKGSWLIEVGDVRLSVVPHFFDEDQNLSVAVPVKRIRGRMHHSPARSVY